MGHQVEVVSPDQFKTFPLPTYPEIKLAMGFGRARCAEKHQVSRA